MKAEYECIECGCQYDREKPEVTACPNCGSFYIQWLNYKQWHEKVMVPKYGNKY